MKDQNLFKLIIVLIVGSVLSACTQLKSVGGAAVAPTATETPTAAASTKNSVITFKSTTVSKPSDSQVTTNIIFNATNPNDTKLRNIEVTYVLTAKGKQFYSGGNIRTILNANATTKIPVPISVNYNKLFSVISKSDDGSVKITAQIKIVGDSTSYNKPITFKIPVPKKIKEREEREERRNKGEDDEDDDDDKKKRKNKKDKDDD